MGIPNYQSWWDRLGATNINKIQAKIKEKYETLTGMPMSKMAAWQHREFVINLYQQASETGKFMPSDTELNKRIEWGVKNLSGTKPQYEAYKDAENNFIASFKAQTGNQYDKKTWTDDKIREQFHQRVVTGGGDLASVGQYVEDIVATVNRDFSDKVAAGVVDTSGNRIAGQEGKLDASTGMLKEGWEQISMEGQSQDLDNLFNSMGLDKTQNKPLYDHIQEMVNKNEINIYEAQQLMQSDPTYIKQEYERVKTEYEPTLAESTKRELALIEQEGERLKGVTEQEFKKFAPDVAMTARKYGGATREDTYISDTLAKYRADLEAKRQDYMSQMKLQSQFMGEERRRAFEAGDFGTLKGLTGEAATQGLQRYSDLLKQQQKTQDMMTQTSMQRSALLAQRSQERYMREVEKQQKRLLREQQDAITRANKKARKLGSYVDYGTAAAGIALAPFTGGASLAMTAQGGLSAYARQAGTTAPQLDTGALSTFAQSTYPQSWTYGGGGSIPFYARYPQSQSALNYYKTTQNIRR